MVQELLFKEKVYTKWMTGDAQGMTDPGCWMKTSHKSSAFSTKCSGELKMNELENCLKKTIILNI